MAEKKEVKKPEKTAKEAKPVKEKIAVKETETNQAELKEAEEGKKESYLKDLMAIGGHGGLFRFISQGRNGIIVESLDNGKRMLTFATMKVSALDDIAIFTEAEEIKLEEVLARIYKYQNGTETISPKSDNDDLKDYFSAVLPEYDRNRVYISDIKKVLNWYNLLLKYDLLKIDNLKKKPEVKEKASIQEEPGVKPKAITQKEPGIKPKAETRKKPE